MMGKVPDRLRDATDHMAFTMLDVMLEGELARQKESREQQASGGAAERHGDEGSERGFA